MSESDDDLELQALQRELDDAFATTRPRVGFDDELWTRMQASRPLGGRVREALAGMFGAIRSVPAVPAAAVATVLVLALGIGLLSLNGLGRPNSATSGSQAVPAELSQQGPGTRNNAGSGAQYGQFGRLPSPASPPAAPGFALPGAPDAVTPYFGPAIATWSGQLIVGSSAPVFRYSEPTADTADKFAASVGATLLDRQAGFLGEYETADYTLKVRGTNISAPAFFILSAPNMPPISVEGASPGDLAVLFLADHNLLPEWPYATAVTQDPNTLTKVQLLREFDVPGYGNAKLVDYNGERYGIEVDLNGNRPVLVSGPLPLETDSANYPIVSPDQAIAPAVAAGGAAPPGSPTVNMTKAELVYVLVPNGGHSFYEPEYLFTGTFKQGNVTYEKRLLLPAVDPSQLCSGTCR
jgi:hypothetical protein